MPDDERRPLTEEERARIHAARNRGGMCAACGRALVEGETIWFERVRITGLYGESRPWWVPVGAECIAPETLRATCDAEPERCLGCGRGIYGLAEDARRRVVSCSTRCAARVTAAWRGTASS